MAPSLRAAALILLLAGGPAAAPAWSHEFWIVPQRFAPDVGEQVPLRLFVGDGLAGGAPYPRDPTHMLRFFARGGSEGPVAGVPGRDPAGWLQVTGRGTVAIGYASRPRRIELTGSAFARYLEREGLDAALALHRHRGGPTVPVREQFSRCAKTLLRAGSPAADAPLAPRLGLALELVPETDPSSLAEGSALPVLLLWQGRPLVGAQVSVHREAGGGREVQRTDAAGRARVALDGPGLVLLSAVHMRAGAPHEKVDWASTWSSLTFEVPRTRRPGSRRASKETHP